MSRKHEKFNISKPNQVDKSTGAVVPLTDKFGVSLDPKEFAKPSCRTCHGRGVFILSGLPKPCLCTVKRRERVVRFAEAAIRFGMLREDNKDLDSLLETAALSPFVPVVGSGSEGKDE